MASFKPKQKAVGVDDMVLITKLKEDEVTENLKKRHAADSIYTYIGDVLISVNPFKLIPGLCTPDQIDNYRDKFLYENPPHIYAIAERAYRSLKNDGDNQCIIITGESGAGKTEASKLIMQYVAAVSGNGDGVERVKRIILESNPLLESFGNAKTVRNNNSSRFGKYFEIQFDRKGSPIGGKITNYLLEKSRVVYQTPGERNFHIFYQLCAGSSPEERQELACNDPKDFFYLNQSDSYTVENVDDKEEYIATRKAMTEIGLSKQEQKSIMKIIAGILWLGNVSFVDNGQTTVVADVNTLNFAAYLLGVDPTRLQLALLYRTITTGGSRRGSTYQVPQNPDQAGSNRDAIAKALYDRLFNWIVERINKAFGVPEREPLVIGVLDIYGFEIFKKNGFEQLCINYVNEKLQQIFIDLTLKSEQEEYNNEGIQWTPIKFFNNKIVCDLIEENKPPGIFAVLDDTCNTTHSMESSKADEKFIQRMGDSINSPYYVGRMNEFIIKHYAGEVVYNIDGFTDKNKDTLYNTLIDVMQSSNDPFITQFFPEQLSEDSKKKPTTAGFKIKKSANELVVALRKCTPSYIRCIKPNETKKARDFDQKRVLHQVQYLGLLENIRVRRAGYAYRHFFDKFLEKFNILSKKTWPVYKGDARTGCEVLLKDLNIDPQEWQMGKTKVFLRHPETLFSLEEMKEQKFHDSAALIQRTYRNWKLKKYFLDLRSSAADLLQSSKERRRISLNRVYLGDYINFLQNAQVQEIMKPHAQEGGVVFADIFQKPFKKQFKGILQENIYILVNPQAIYCIERVKVKKQFIMQLTQRVPWSQLEGISMSQLADNFVIIHVRDGEDIFCEGNNKTEFLSIVNDTYKQSLKRDVTRTFNNNLTYNGPKKKKCTVQFTKDLTGKSKLAKISGGGGKWAITINEGLAPTSKPKVIQRKEPQKQAAKAGGNKAPGLNANAYQSANTHHAEAFASTPAYVPPTTKSAAPPPLPASKDNRPKCKAMYDYNGSAGDELTIKVGDLIAIIEKDASGWWLGELISTKKKGLFPGNYVQELN